MKKFYFPRVPAFTADHMDARPFDHAYTPVDMAQWVPYRRRSQGLGENAVSTLARAAAGAVQGVTIESQILPPLSWSPVTGAQTGGGGFGEWFARNIVKPKVTVQISGQPVSYALYGEPTADYFPLLATASVGLAAGAAWLMLRGLGLAGKK